MIACDSDFFFALPSCLAAGDFSAVADCAQTGATTRQQTIEKKTASERHDRIAFTCRELRLIDIDSATLLIWTARFQAMVAGVGMDPGNIESTPPIAAGFDFKGPGRDKQRPMPHPDRRNRK
jgi:hypothetical protein